MALLYPDILQHNNSTKALVDITEIRGNSYPINLLSDTGSIPADKRKVGAIVFVSSSQNFYGFYGQTTASWDTPANWRSLGGTIDTGSFVTTSSFNAFTSSYNTGSFTGSFIGTHTGSLFGTSSLATNAITAQTASFITGSNVYGPFGANSVISSSNAQTASFVLQAVSSSFASTASFAPNYQLTSGTGSMLAPYVLTASTSSMTVLSASFASTASFAQGGNGSFSGSFSGSGANLNSIPTTAVVGNFTRIATNSVTASVTPTQFSVVSGSMTEFLVTGTGVILGGAITDTHIVTGSLTITGSNTIIGNQTITGSLVVSSSNATQFLVGNNSLFANSTGNVGIGTTTPSATLDVNGSVNISGSAVQVPLQVYAGVLPILQVSSSGKISIGSAVSQGYALEVYSTGILYAGASSAAQLLITTSGSVNREGAFIAASTGRTIQMGISDNSTVPVGIDMFAVNNNYDSSYLNFRVNNANLIRMTGSFVGIGTTTPSATLDVSGSARITNGLTVTGSSILTNGQTTIQGSSAVTGNALVVSNSTPTPLLTIQNNGQVIITGSLSISGSFNLPLSQTITPQTGSAYWSGSLLFIYNGARYMSASFF